MPSLEGIEDCLSSEYECPGVYVVSGDEPLYVGETRNLRDRFEKVVNTETWARFSPRHVHVWKLDSEKDQFGLRSYLVREQKPLLNSAFLQIE